MRTVLLLVVSTSIPSPGATRYVQARGVYLMPMPYHHGKRTRWTRAMSARAIRFLLSIAIHRRPHCSATYGMVPPPHVGSRIRSPGSVVIKTHRGGMTVFILVLH